MQAQGEAGGIQAPALSGSSLSAREPVNSPCAGTAEAPQCHLPAAMLLLHPPAPQGAP